MRSAVPAVADRCLQLTAAFEGHGFGRAQGNFDGAGITWGIIGFTLQHQGIRKVVRTIQKQHPELVRKAFGSKTPELISIVGAPWKDRLAWADSVSLGTTKTRLAQPWRRAFERFGEMEPVQALQVELANKEYFRPAVQTAQEYALRSELGLSLALTFTSRMEECRREPASRSEGFANNTPSPANGKCESSLPTRLRMPPRLGGAKTSAPAN